MFALFFIITIMVAALSEGSRSVMVGRSATRRHSIFIISTWHWLLPAALDDKKKNKKIRLLKYNNNNNNNA